MPFKRFRGGVHPHDSKSATERLPVENVPIPKEVILPMQQHIGAPAEPVVQKGDTVKTGQIIGKSKGFVSVPVHATLSGPVTAVEPRPHPLGVNLLSVVIESDDQDQWETPQIEQSDPGHLSAEEIRTKIHDAGIAGMGGASFPTHVKLSPPADKPIDTLIVNGVECEPYLTADHRLMLEKTDELLKGLRLLMISLDVKRALIGIEKNKPDAIKLLKEKTSQLDDISIVPLTVKYPQGSEKQLIKAAAGREVPSGKLPMDVGCVVQNVGTIVAVYEAVYLNKPLIERVVTVTGPGIHEPKNCLVRLGTPFKDLIAFCGGLTDQASKIINGGPMMGISQVSEDVPVIKGTSGILVLNQKTSNFISESPCISCARCVDICPMGLMPNQLARLVEFKYLDKASDLGLYDCMECGSCSFICPAKRNLVQYIKTGKALLNEEKRKTG